jgi:predicted nucleotidyltransferase
MRLPVAAAPLQDELLSRGLNLQERQLLERFVQALEERLGGELQAVWLFGSRARDEPDRSADSDIDLLVITTDASLQASSSIYDLLFALGRELGREEAAWHFSIHVHDPGWLAQRRAVRAFFIAEVERDKLVLSGSA